VGFTKIIKNKAYFKRYQVKLRRRREGKTDYYARKRLVTQDKTKYASPKYRFVVRITNRDVICQLIFSKIIGDRVICSAYAHELARYGIPAGQNNYAGCYATGLLLARRHLTNLGLADSFVGNTGNIGDDFLAERRESDQRRPFKALLDIGLKRTTTGSRIFAALKGACDGGLAIPHSAKRFIGSKGDNTNPALLRSYILGSHVANWMRLLKERDETTYNRHFSKYVAAGVTPDSLEKLWLAAHEKIRSNPARIASTKPPVTTHKRFGPRARTLAQRKDRIRQILASRSNRK